MKIEKLEPKIINEIYEAIEDDPYLEEREELLTSFKDEILPNLLENLPYTITDKALSYMYSGDYEFSTNLWGTSPFYAFIVVNTENQSEAQLQKRLNNLNKKAAQFLDEQHHSNNDKVIALNIFKLLPNYFGEETKFFIKDNIINIKIEDKVKFRIIVGYSHEEGVLDYKYFNSYISENYIKNVDGILELLDKDSSVIDAIKILKFLEKIYFEKVFKKATHPKSNNSHLFIEYLLTNVDETCFEQGNISATIYNIMNFLNKIDVNKLKKPDGTNLFKTYKNNGEYEEKKLKLFISNINSTINFLNAINEIKNKFKINDD